jgi:redox-sensitive bicupin YhaK (pirin superfamily)
MSWLTDTNPSICHEDHAALDLLIEPAVKDLGGFRVRRALPSAKRQMIGPFIFLDHMGPAHFDVDEGMDVRPHPHIGLATLTYLLEGSIFHRDTLGSALNIIPGDVNWMTAGRGIAHSERSSPEARKKARDMAGVQSWIALPRSHEEATPGFFHHDGQDLPLLQDTGVHVRIVAGTAYGKVSPVQTFSSTLYADVSLAAHAKLPLPGEHAERSAYVLSGKVEVAGEVFGEHLLLVFRPGDNITLTAVTDCRLMLIGGEPMDGPRHIWWNFVSSSKDRIEQAKSDWRAGKFGLVPGDEREFIPLPP